jgi:hypothetical protein
MKSKKGLLSIVCRLPLLGFGDRLMGMPKIIKADNIMQIRETGTWLENT